MNIMRTDPRADEVRCIVERVFAGYLSKGRRRKAEGGRPWGRNRLAGQFPRLYEPEECDVDEESQADTKEIDETILIDQGRYVARSYRTSGYMAMWLVAAGIVQFYDDRGRMLATINLFESLRPERMAA